MFSKLRERVLKALHGTYIIDSSDWCDLTIAPSGKLNLTIVSQVFDGKKQNERRDDIRSLVGSAAPGAAIGFLSLYSPQEAISVELKKPPSTALPAGHVATWHDLAHLAANGQSSKPKSPVRDLPRTIAFYSFKGGVGRTTALIHVAAILAQRGRKVVAVDLDLEAPGLGAVAKRSLDLGLIDYLYERAFMPQDSKPNIHIGTILNELDIPDSPGRFFIVPAGNLDLDYISKVDELRTIATSESMYAAWQLFVDDLTDQIRPDLILVDSRTGINEWGALSTFRAADETIIFLFPSHQNAIGIDLILRAFLNVGLPPIHLVFSPVPDADKAGMAKVDRFWKMLQGSRDPLTSNEDDEAEDGLAEDEPLIIPYLQGIALSEIHPVEEFTPHYSKLANLIDSETTSIKTSRELIKSNYRWDVLEDLRFPKVNATDPRHKLDEIFQRTADFDRFLDPTTCLIRGRKGTGKSALYWFFLDHFKEAEKLAQERLRGVSCVSGHGRYRERPSQPEFLQIGEKLKERSEAWEAAWRGYFLLRLRLEKRLPRLQHGKFQPLREIMNKAPRSGKWQSEHTHAVLSLSKGDLTLLAKDALDIVDRKLGEKGENLWILYDDLDEDLSGLGRGRFDALTGLFQFLQSSDAQRHTCLKFKVFIREDIWARTIFDNRSHFNGRDILLQWSRIDFLRLSLRLAKQSRLFEQLVDRVAPVADVDRATEETLEKALQILWGSRREAGSGRRSKYVSRWVYERLTDSSGTTFPRSLSELLEAARDHELSYRETHVQTPGDRLLRARSLNEGLHAASQQRCNEVREEYRELTSFFDQLRGKSIFLTRGDLRKLWDSTGREIGEFDDFLEMIEGVGLATWRENEERFRFADLYIDGFNMNRSRAKI